MTDPHHAALIDRLVADGFAAATISARTLDGPHGTRIALAQSQGAYPGTGTKAMLLDGDSAIDFADLVRRRGWLARPPDAASLVELANYAFWSGNGLPDGERPMTATVSQGELQLRFVRRVWPTLGRDAVTVVVGAHGPARVSATSGEPEAPPAPIAIDAVTALVRAVEAGDGNAILDAIDRVRPSGPREIAALARAAMQMNNRIASGALHALGASDDAARALRDALGAATPERRVEVIRIAGEYYGPAFAAQLEKP